jgi:predicted signal transduction protein with EAL and GGDEF domain
LSSVQEPVFKKLMEASCRKSAAARQNLAQHSPEQLPALRETGENATQLALLRELGCDEAQGYHIARPMKAHQLEALLATSLDLAPVALASAACSLARIAFTIGQPAAAQLRA